MHAFLSAVQLMALQKVSTSFWPVITGIESHANTYFSSQKILNYSWNIHFYARTLWITWDQLLRVCGMTVEQQVVRKVVRKWEPVKQNVEDLRMQVAFETPAISQIKIMTSYRICTFADEIFGEEIFSFCTYSRETKPHFAFKYLS